MGNIQFNDWQTNESSLSEDNGCQILKIHKNDRIM